MRENVTGRLGVFGVGLVVFAFLMTGFVVYMAGASSGFWGNQGGEEEGAAGGEEGVDMVGAQEIFSTRCVPCHGQTGRGDGPGSAGLAVHPRNFTDSAWQAEVDNEHIRRIIISGGAAVGRNPAMPNNPDLRERPEVVQGLIRIIRGFGRR